MANTIDRLKAQLLKSGLQVKDQILFQIINQLIDAVSQNSSSISGTGGSSSGGITLGQSFATIENEQGSLSNSRQIYPGEGIQFNNQGQKLVISSAIPFSIDGEDGIEGLQGVQGIQGLKGDKGDPGTPGSGSGISIPFFENIEVPEFEPSFLSINPGGLNSFLGIQSFLNYIDLISGQIRFPATQNPSSNANTFDDYEEGTWTPALNINGSTAGITYASRSGTYTKEAQLVELEYIFTLTSKGASVGPATITGIPFSTNAAVSAPIDFATGIAGGVVKIPFQVAQIAVIYFLMYTAIGTRVQMSDAELTNTSVVQGSVLYRV